MSPLQVTTNFARSLELAQEELHLLNSSAMQLVAPMLLLASLAAGLKAPQAMCRRQILDVAAAAAAAAAGAVIAAPTLANAAIEGVAPEAVDLDGVAAAIAAGRNKKGSARLRSTTAWTDGADAGIEQRFQLRKCAQETDYKAEAAVKVEVPVAAAAAPEPELVAAAPAPAEDALPKGWVTAVDPMSGKTFYGNVDTKAVQWDRPT